MQSVLLLKSSSVPEDDSKCCKDAYITELERLFVPLLVNTLSFTFFSLDVLISALQKPSDYSGIIFTSPRAVQAVQKAISLFGESEWKKSYQPIWKTKKIYCVGEATERNVLTDLGLSGVGGSTGNAAILASFIIETFPKEETLPLLFPSGELRREELPEILKAAALPFHPLTVYNTTVSPSLKKDLEGCLLKVGLFDYAVFFSPSGVRFSKPVLEELLDLNRVKFIAIGPTTKKALETAGLPVHKVCDRPTPAALRQLLEEDISS